jgi:hypothetical protein
MANEDRRTDPRDARTLASPVVPSAFVRVAGGINLGLPANGNASLAIRNAVRFYNERDAQ